MSADTFSSAPVPGIARFNTSIYSFEEDLRCRVEIVLGGARRSLHLERMVPKVFGGVALERSVGFQTHPCRGQLRLRPWRSSEANHGQEELILALCYFMMAECARRLKC
jgi:hypothetical protein